MRRGVGEHNQPPQEHLLSITSRPRQCDSVAHLWAPPPTALPSTAAAPVFALAALIPLQAKGPPAAHLGYPSVDFCHPC